MQKIPFKNIFKIFFLSDCRFWSNTEIVEIAFVKNANVFPIWKDENIYEDVISFVW